ncbi:MAG TPA: hypothetical protein VIX89_10305 [Bryobacteraceae bacterium]
MSDISTNQSPATGHKSQPQHSTGPRTDAGKQRSSLNALRHGLTGQTVVLPSDDLAAYQLHCQEFLDQYQPKNKMEVQLTQTIADLTWRLNRVTAIEANLLTLGIAEQSHNVDTENGQAHSALAMAKAFHQQSRAMVNFSIYEHRLSLRLQKTTKQLEESQAARMAQEKLDMHSAAKILQMHKNKKVPYNPTEDGFVFSNTEIETYIQRRNRQDQAYGRPT